jgi:hypothetical protein
MDRMAKKGNQHLPLQDTPKFTQIGILVSKYAIWQPRSSQTPFSRIPTDRAQAR